jgi:acyl carrier protein
MEALISKLKEQLIEQLNLEDYTPEDINEDESLFESEMGLDSIDALEIIVLLEQEYGVKIQNKEDGQKIFHSVRTIAEHIQANS